MNGTYSGAERSEYAIQLAETEIISRENFDAALGPLRQYLANPAVQDVNVNPDGRIWVSTGERKIEAPEQMRSEARQTLIGMLANRQHRSVDRLHSRLAGDMPYYGVRFQCFGPPIAEWALCLRCHAPTVRPLADLGEMLTRGPHAETIAGPAAGESGFLAALRGAVARGRQHRDRWSSRRRENDVAQFDAPRIGDVPAERPARDP